MQNQSPIFVTGMPRSGTTLMQHVLSQHPRIVIHGQEPKGVAWGEWLRILNQGILFAKQSNARLDYECPHYAGATADSQQISTQLLNMIRDYATGSDSTTRWGLKSLTQCRIAGSRLLKVWPETRWVVCVRHPMRSFESLRNTFDRNATFSVEELALGWCKAVSFGLFHPQAMLVQCDQLRTPQQRHQRMIELFQFLGENYQPEVQQFVDQWPIVHKVVADEDRQTRMSDEERDRLKSKMPLLIGLADKLGYRWEISR